ncbi:radical SAM protein [Candidatus Microgenomates bacterium]|nr:radical SAM protein [Candidatus Microgenomates bacterium]
MNNLKWQQIFPNLFIVSDDYDEVVYSPLLGKFFYVSCDGIKLINDFLDIGKPENHEFYQYLLENNFFQEVELPREAKKESFGGKDLTISITSACNLRCIYCYARAGNDFKDLPWKYIEISIRKMIDSAQRKGEREVELSFHGTGESIVRWDTMVKTVNFLLKEKPVDWKANFHLVTNGTLIDDEKASFLAKHNFSVVLSFDGTADIQNILRPKADGTGSFDDAINGAKSLVRFSVPFTMRSTITGLNQDEMLDFLELCASIGCKEISVAPFSLTGRGESGVPDINAEKFVTHYIACKKRARELNVSFSMPSDHLDNASARYCGADGETFAVMPDGSISCCTRVTHRDDVLGEVFFVGDITDSGIEIQQEKIRKLQSFNMYHFPECQGCFAKFTCGGGCHHTRLISGNKQPENYCEIMRGVLWNTLRDAALNPE